MKNAKSELFDLDMLMESVTELGDLSADMTDDSASILENLDISSDLNSVLESSDSLFGTKTKPAKVENEVKDLFSLLEAAEEVAAEKVAEPVNAETLKNKKVLLRNPEGNEKEAIVSDVVGDTVTLSGINGGSTAISKDAFKTVFVREVIDTVAAATPQEAEVKAEIEKSPEVAAVKSEEKIDETPVSTGVEENKEPPIENKGKVAMESNNGMRKIENPVDHDEFVKSAIAAKEGMNKGANKNIEKLPAVQVKTKLLNNSKKFETFVESFRDENPALIGCVLEAFDAYKAYMLTKFEGVEGEFGAVEETTEPVVEKTFKEKFEEAGTTLDSVISVFFGAEPEEVRETLQGIEDSKKEELFKKIVECVKEANALDAFLPKTEEETVAVAEEVAPVAPEATVV